MPWPTPQEYNEAIQHPALCFADAELRSGAPDLTPLGLPRPITGNFASVYRLRGAHDWAVRCFFREYADSGERYAAISTHLSAARLRHTVGFEYLERGIRVGSSWFPVLKMQWVEGKLLGEFVAANRHDPTALRELSERWLDMLGEMEQRAIAHGDLQHGNVLVVGGDLRLVDYDGMFVPALKGRVSYEVGHPNYQHPGRTGRHFSADLDRFSGWIIYLSLLALQRAPDLWDELQAGDECLLFRRADFEAPAQSPVLARLRTESALRPIADQVERVLMLPPQRIPPVASLEARRPHPTARGTAPRSALPAWLEGSIPPPPAPRFRWPAYVPRLLALLTACVTLGVSIASSLPVAGAGVVGVTVEMAALWLAYATDPAVVGRTATRSRLQFWRLQMYRVALVTWAGGYRVRLAQRGYGRSVARLARKRGVARKEHERSLALIHDLLGARVEYLEEQLRVVDADRKEAEEHVRQALSDRVVEKRLRSSSMLTARIDGVGLPARSRLWLGGVRTARHVSTERAAALRDLEPAQAAAILRWRSELEKDARRRSTQEIPRPIARLFDAEYGRRISALRRKRSKQERRIQGLSQRASLVLDLQVARVDRRIVLAAQRQEQVEVRHQERRAAHAERRMRLENEAEALVEEMQTVQHLTFRHYLRTVVGREAAGRL